MQCMKCSVCTVEDSPKSPHAPSISWMLPAVAIRLKLSSIVTERIAERAKTCSPCRYCREKPRTGRLIAVAQMAIAEPFGLSGTPDDKWSGRAQAAKCPSSASQYTRSSTRSTRWAWRRWSYHASDSNPLSQNHTQLSRGLGARLCIRLR